MPKDRGDEKEGTQGRVKIKPELLDEALKEYRGFVASHQIRNTG
jgi:hypothetical protein